MVTDPVIRGEAAGGASIALTPSAVVRFRYVPSGSGVSRSGPIRPGAPLTIAYDPTRLANAAPGGGAPPDYEILGHVRFHPGGQVASALVARRAASGPVPIAVLVPADAARIEVWFERRGGAGADGWDSRYGQNFWFEVDRADPAVPLDSVSGREGTLVDAGTLAILADDAVKERTACGGAGSRVIVRLAVEARIRDAAGARAAWADVHVYDGADDLIHAATVALDRAVGGDGDAARFAWNDAIYRGSGGGSGVGVELRPDAHLVQYRVYGEVQGRVLTDGVLHQLALPPDHEVAADAARRAARVILIEPTYAQCDDQPAAAGPGSSNTGRRIRGSTRGRGRERGRGRRRAARGRVHRGPGAGGCGGAGPRALHRPATTPASPRASPRTAVR
jgi:hypothetical protein